MTGADDYDWARKIGARTYDLPNTAEMLGMKNFADQVVRDTQTINASPARDFILAQYQTATESPFKAIADDIMKRNAAYLTSSFDTSKFAERLVKGVTMPESPVKAMLDRINEQTRSIALGSPTAGQQIAEYARQMQAEMTQPNVDWFRREVLDPAVEESLEDLDASADEFVQSVQDFVAASTPELDAVADDLLATDSALEAKVKMTTGWQTLVAKLPGVGEARLVRLVITYVVSMGIFFLPDDVKADLGTYAGVVALLLATNDTLNKKSDD